MKNQNNMTPPKEYSDFPGTNSKEMELQEFADKEFKIIALRKLCELQEYPSVQLHEIRKTIREQKDQQRDRNHKKIQTEILERKNTRNEITNAVQNIHGRLDQEKEITSASRQAFEITESEEKK